MWGFWQTESLIFIKMLVLIDEIHNYMILIYWQKRSGANRDKHFSKEMYERRPLKTVTLTPPDYHVNPQLLQESYVEKEVRVCIIFIERLVQTYR